MSMCEFRRAPVLFMYAGFLSSSSEAICYIEAEINGANVIGVGRSKDVLDAGFKALTAAAGQVIIKPNHEKSTA